MPTTRYIACDLGAESGRVVLGHLSHGRLELAEVHRFPTAAVRLPGPSLRWDVLAIFAELKAGLRAVARLGKPVAGVSVDAWGVDYAYTAAGQPLLWPPYHYRDPRTARTYGPLVEQLGADYIFGRTGVQFMPINTLYQLAADVADHPSLLPAAKDLLLIGDYFNYLFSGVARAEESAASTTQAFDPVDRGWAFDLLDLVGLPPTLFPSVVPPGTVLGPLLPEVAAEVGLPTGVRVIATCSHDTGAAVAAVPAEPGDDWAYLSSGTWSLLGVELPAPLVNDDVRAANFTNEAGFGGTTRLLKNVSGLWLIQELRRAWAAAGQELSYAEVTGLAEMNEPFRSLIDPSDARFAGHCDMPSTIAGYCRETGQPEPASPGQFARCAFESLALLYRATLSEVEALTGRTVRRVHVVGGGSRNALLNGFTADATGRTVVAGPVEASAVGNVLVQAIAVGQLGSLADARRVVRDSFPVTTVEPTGDPAWVVAYGRFQLLRSAARSDPLTPA